MGYFTYRVFDPNGTEIAAAESQLEATIKATDAGIGATVIRVVAKDTGDKEPEHVFTVGVDDLVKYVFGYAYGHYNDGGWDVIIETTTLDEVKAEIVEAQVTTPIAALMLFDARVDVWADRQADARNSAF